MNDRSWNFTSCNITLFSQISQNICSMPVSKLRVVKNFSLVLYITDRMSMFKVNISHIIIFWRVNQCLLRLLGHILPNCLVPIPVSQQPSHSLTSLPSEAKKRQQDDDQQNQNQSCSKTACLLRMNLKVLKAGAFSVPGENVQFDSTCGAFLCGQLVGEREVDERNVAREIAHVLKLIL